MSIRSTAAAVVFSVAVFFPGAFAGTVGVSDGWFRALPGSLPAGGYFKLHNASGNPVVLTAAQSPGCGMVMLHMSMHGSGMDHMMAVDKVDVAPGQTFEFAPGGYHLMCMNPTPAMKPGATLPVTLRFADGSAITSSFAVKGASGK
jgi:copper(I)-binding protein